MQHFHISDFLKSCDL